MRSATRWWTASSGISGIRRSIRTATRFRVPMARLPQSESGYRHLASCREGERFRLMRVADQSPEFLRYLSSIRPAVGSRRSHGFEPFRVGRRERERGGSSHVAWTRGGTKNPGRSEVISAAQRSFQFPVNLNFRDWMGVYRESVDSRPFDRADSRTVQIGSRATRRRRMRGPRNGEL